MPDVNDPANPDEFDPAAIGEKLAAMVEQEAAQAEAETPVDDDEPEAEGEDQKFERAVIAAYDRYMTEIVQLFGADQTVSPCTYCHGFGFNPVELKADTHSRPCEFCDGHGQVTTFSKVQGNEARQCLDCKGAGFIADPIVLTPVTAVETEPPAVLSEAELAEIVRNAQAQAGTNVA